MSEQQTTYLFTVRVFNNSLYPNPVTRIVKSVSLDMAFAELKKLLHIVNDNQDFEILHLSIF